MKTRFQNAQRGFHHQFDANRRRQMKNELRVRRQLRQPGTRGNFRLNHAQPRMRFDRAQIFQAAGGKIVNDNDRFAISQQALDGRPFDGSVGLPLPLTELSIRDAADRELAIGEQCEFKII